MLKKNNLWLGLALGLLLPVASYFIIELILKLANNDTFRESTQQVVSITANVFLFRHYMIRWKMEETGKGMLMATLVYAAIFAFYTL